MNALLQISGFGQKCGDPFFCVVCERLAAKAGLLRDYLAEQDRLESADEDSECNDEGCLATHALPDWMGDV